MFRVLALLAVIATITQGASFPGPPPLKTGHMYGEKTNFKTMSIDKWEEVIGLNSGPMETEAYPGYKRGTKRMADECGMPGVGPQTFITGGNEATPHEYPWMAALFFEQEIGAGSYFCGGTLISDEWVMTAAHCVDGAKSMKVFLGAHNVREETEEGRLEFQIEETDENGEPNWFAHPSWISFLIKNDIGLIRLPENINFTENIRPVCLPSYSDSADAFAGLTAPASGWGKPTDSATSISPTLQEVETETITNLVCIFELFTITKTNICISGKGGKSTCNGDSGGPLHKRMEDGRMKQIGITSFGLSLGCELGLHAAFTRTSSYLGFIESNTDIQIEP